MNCRKFNKQKIWETINIENDSSKQKEKKNNKKKNESNNLLKKQEPCEASCFVDRIKYMFFFMVIGV